MQALLRLTNVRTPLRQGGTGRISFTDYTYSCCMALTPRRSSPVRIGARTPCHRTCCPTYHRSRPVKHTLRNANRTGSIGQKPMCAQPFPPLRQP